MRKERPFFLQTAAAIVSRTAPRTRILKDEADEEPNATLYSKDYLTIGVPLGGAGTGQLTVNANYNDGITGKDGVIINGGAIAVDAVDDGIRGKDYLLVIDGDISVATTSGDGFKSDKSGDSTRGYVSVEGGTINLAAGGDGIQAETYLLVYEGDITLESGGGAGTDFDEENESKKGLKAGLGVLIRDGQFSLDAADDAVHSDDFIEIDGGEFDIYSGDDGVHGEFEVLLQGGDVAVWESYEGIEGQQVTFKDGTFSY